MQLYHTIHSDLFSVSVAIKDCKNDEYKRLIGPSNLLWRTPEVEQRRLKDYQKDGEKWASTAERLRCESFGYTATENEEGKLVAVQLGCDEETAKGGQKKAWMKNKFPYAFEEGVHHDVCFFTSIQGRDYCIDTIKDKLGPGLQTVWFTNSVANRSVPEIDHIQVIYRDSPFIGDSTKYKTSIIRSMKSSVLLKKPTKPKSVGLVGRMPE